MSTSGGIHITKPSNYKGDRKYRGAHGIFEIHCLCNNLPVQQSVPTRKHRKSTPSSAIFWNSFRKISVNSSEMFDRIHL